MCGIVGLITGSANGFHFNETSALRDMAFADSLRGWDSTGIMYGTNREAVQIHKGAIPGPAFLCTKEWDSSKNELFSVGKWAVVHNRAATRGDKTDANAHPFIVNDKIILVQNGTYKGSHKHLKDTEVDSEACAHVIAENEDISKALKSINAAYAFVWYNVATKTLNIIRNDERPLYLAEAKNGSVFFASEEGILDFALKRNDVKVETGPYLLAAGHLLQYEMDGGNDKEVFNKIDIEYTPTKKESTVPFREHTPTTPGRSGKNTTMNDTETPTPLPKKQSRVWQRGQRAEPIDIGQALMYINSELTPLRSLEMVSDLQESLNDHRGEKFVIEGQDYVKIHETDVNDPHYYIFGTILAPEHELDGELVCWEVESDPKKEKELLHYVTDNYFSAHLNYLIRRRYGADTNAWMTTFYLNKGVEICGSAVKDEVKEDEKVH